MRRADVPGGEKATPARRSRAPGGNEQPPVPGRDKAGRRPGPDDYASRVLDVVDSIPSGTVMSYGDVAEYLGDGGPRQVGRVMALWGGGVAWWRVVHADGSLLAGHEQAALARYAAEGTPLRQHAAGGPPRLDMRRARLRP